MYYPIGLMDASYMLVLLGMVLCLIAQSNVKRTYSKYSKVMSVTGLTGAQTAERILRQNGIYDVRIARVSGELTDHYDSSNKVLSLSEGVFDKSSVAAVSVAAHECGHAIQDDTGYMPLRLRSSLVPVANFGAGFSWPLIIIGIMMGWNQTLIQIGIIMFSAVVLFHFVTLPVELDASARALREMEGSGILQDQENSYARKVLRAAALTYIASAASMALQLLRLLLLSRRSR